MFIHNPFKIVYNSFGFRSQHLKYVDVNFGNGSTFPFVL